MHVSTGRGNSFISVGQVNLSGQIRLSSIVCCSFAHQKVVSISASGLCFFNILIAELV